jgi:hypothetical protein
MMPGGFRLENGRFRCKLTFNGSFIIGSFVPLSPIRVLDTSLTASGSVYLNKRPKLGSEQGGLNVHLWVETADSW